MNFTGLPSCSLHRPKDTQIHMRRAVVVAACCRRAAIFDQDVVTWHAIRVAVIQGISRAFRRGCRERNWGVAPPFRIRLVERNFEMYLWRLWRELQRDEVDPVEVGLQGGYSVVFLLFELIFGHFLSSQYRHSSSSYIYTCQKCLWGNFGRFFKYRQARFQNLDLGDILAP